MMKRTKFRFVPFALCATGLLAIVFAGCDRKDEAVAKAVEPPANSPAVYMNDTNFLARLDEKRGELKAIVKERAPLVKRMEELVKEHGEKLADLQKIPEWGELHKKVVALNAKYEEVRKRQLVIASQRLKPAAKTQPGAAAATDDKKVSK